MTSRAGALIARPSWGRAAPRRAEEAIPRLATAPARPRVRWGIQAPAALDLLGGAAILAATAGLWVATLLAAW